MIKIRELWTEYNNIVKIKELWTKYNNMAKIKELWTNYKHKFYLPLCMGVIACLLIEYPMQILNIVIYYISTFLEILDMIIFTIVRISVIVTIVLFICLSEIAHNNKDTITQIVTDLTEITSMSGGIVDKLKKIDNLSDLATTIVNALPTSYINKLKQLADNDPLIQKMKNEKILQTEQNLADFPSDEDMVPVKPAKYIGFFKEENDKMNIMMNYNMDQLLNNTVVANEPQLLNMEATIDESFEIHL